MKINPQHTVPTLDDNGDVVIDSHAIVTYLVSKFGGAEHASLCPTDPYERAKMDHRLHFDNGTLYNRFGKLFGPVHRGLPIEEESLRLVCEGLDFLELFLEDDYVAGKNMTVADFACVTTVTLIHKIIILDAARYPRILAWIDRLSRLPYYEGVVTAYLDSVTAFLDEKLNRKSV